MYIDGSLWNGCSICGMSIQDMSGWLGSYRHEKLRKHLLEEHGISLESFLEVNGVVFPNCGCGCGEKMSVSSKGGSLLIKDFKKGHIPVTSEKWKRYVQRMKVDRIGAGNPAFGKSSWNKNKTKNTDCRVKAISEKLKGRKASDSSKNKMSESAKARLVHGHTGKKHSDETKQRLSMLACLQIKNQKFPQTKTIPCILFARFLSNLGVRFEEEVIVGFFSFDFFLPDFNVFVEVDGDYWHSNPKFYPNGPKTKSQKINWYRDIKKKQFADCENLTVFHWWEDDIKTQPNKVESEIREKLWALKK